MSPLVQKVKRIFQSIVRFTEAHLIFYIACLRTATFSFGLISSLELFNVLGMHGHFEAIFPCSSPSNKINVHVNKLYDCVVLNFDVFFFSFFFFLSFFISFFLSHMLDKDL